jgi:hypothetical protein
MVVVTGTNGVLTVQSRDGIDSRTSFPAAQHTIASHSATAWRMFYSNATTTAVQELAFGAAGTYLRSGGASAAPTWSTVQYSELGGTVPTWNQSTTGNAATATKLASPVTINGVSFDGSAGITIYDGSKMPVSGGTFTGDIAFSAPAGAAADSRSITFTSRFNSADVVRTLYINSAGTLVFNSVAVSLSGHTHAISDVTGLQTALDAKQPKIVSKLLSSNQTTAGTTLVDASGMSLGLTSGKLYKVEIIGSFASDTPTSGLRLYANFSGSATCVGQSMTTLNGGSSLDTAEHLNIFSTNSTWILSTGVVTANATNTFVISAVVNVTSSGTFKIQFAAEAGSGANITLQQNTTLIVTEITPS